MRVLVPTGVFPIDDHTIGWLRERESYIASAWGQRKPIASDVDGHGQHHPRINSRTIQVSFAPPPPSPQLNLSLGYFILL